MLKFPRRAFALVSSPHPQLPLSLPHLDTLPLRSTSSHSNANLPPESDRTPHEPELSDQEWEMRTGATYTRLGRAIHILRSTYPHFFTTGLVSSLTNAQSNLHSGQADAEEPIYSPKIRLSYTPPVALSLPKGLQTLHIEGLSFYNASAVFVRHTMNALYIDLSVEIKRITVNSSSSSSGSRLTSPPAAPEPPYELEGDSGSEGKRDDADEKHPGRRHRREKSVFISVAVTGMSRVSGSPGTWDVGSTYTFSPTTALVTHHNVNSIHPAPHQSVYEALRGVVFGRSAAVEKGAFGVGAQGRTAEVWVRWGQRPQA